MFFKIPWVVEYDLVPFNGFLRSRRSSCSKYLVKGIHIEREIVNFTLAVSKGRIDKRNKLTDAIHKVPNFFGVSPEDVRTKLMHFNSMHIFSVTITSDVVILFDYKAFLSL